MAQKVGRRDTHQGLSGFFAADNGLKMFIVVSGGSNVTAARDFYSLFHKTVNTREISGMFVSRSFRCQMKPQKITNKPQQGSVTT